MDLADLDATAQAALVADGTCSPSELLEATIAAIERVNPLINAVVIPLFERAREQVTAHGLGSGPFRGVPIVLKDLGATLAGTPQYRGTKVLRDRRWVSPHDSELTARFQRAGFVFVGKTNTPELGLSPTTEPDTFVRRATRGIRNGSSAAPAAGRPRRSRPGSSRSPTPATAEGRSATRPGRAAWWASSRREVGSRSAPNSARRGAAAPPST